MSGKAKILIVDDDQTTRETLEALLYHDGHEILFANSGEEALVQIEIIPPDTILLDVMMDDMDGFEVCQKIKSDKKYCHIPIILVTGLEGKEELSKGIDAGADDFLKKPVNGIELRARVRSMLRLKKQFDELEEIIHLREDLSNMIMHDMKNPLSGIMMACQLLHLKTNAPQDVKYLDTIMNQTRRLELLMNDILVLAKMKAGKLILNCTNVHIDQLLRNVESGYSAISDSRGIKFLFQLPATPCKVLIDVNLFQRVMDNLISNALKFSPNNSTITIQLEHIGNETTSKTDTSFRIKVIDQGFGIDEDDRETVFDKFKVASLKKEGIPQFGLGLAFCKMVVESHEGRIFVESNKPNGSVFIVEM